MTNDLEEKVEKKKKFETEIFLVRDLRYNRDNFVDRFKSFYRRLADNFNSYTGMDLPFSS